MASSQKQQPKMMRAAQFEPGSADLLRIGIVNIPQLREREVLIKVIATAVNRADIVQRRGNYPPPPGESEILGLEAAGIIDSTGPNCKRGWKEGQRVMALLPGGGNAEYVAACEDHIIEIPDDFSFEEAAAIPETWLTAFQLLHRIGRIQAGETVLIHAGGSGVGLAAVQLSKLAGANAIVTAGSDSKIQKAVELGAVGGANYKNGSFVVKVLELTEGQGVDVILDCVGSSYWEQNATVLKLEGRWVLYGLLSGGNVTGNLLGNILRKRIRLEGTTLRSRSKEYKAELVKEFELLMMPYFKEKRLKPIVDCIFPFGKLADAHRYVEDNKNTGKVVILVQNLKESEVDEDI